MIYKKSILWYNKKDFLISQNHEHFVISKNLFCDITNSIFCYHKIDFLISENKPDFFISQIRFCDITNTILWFLIKKKKYFWYHKIWSILNRWNDDSHKKASAGVFPPTKMADKDVCVHLNCACTLIICGSYHFFRELKCKNYFMISQNRLFDITK